MPLYEYECTACHKRTEKIQKFSDPEITVCPKCGGVLERVITAPAIAFKGGGWYADGYGNAKPVTSSGESKVEGASPTASETKSESKPSSSADTGATSTTPAAATSAPTSAPAASAPATK